MADAPHSLPDDPDLGWLRKRAKELRREHPEWKLAEAQWALAKQFGYPSWPALKRYVELVRSYRRAPDEVPRQPDPRDEFLRLACLTYGADDPARWSEAASMDVPVDTVPRRSCARRRRGAATLLATSSAVEEGGPFGWAPLAYLAYARHDPDVTEAQVLESCATPPGARRRSRHGLPLARAPQPLHRTDRLLRRR